VTSGKRGDCLNGKQLDAFAGVLHRLVCGNRTLVHGVQAGLGPAREPDAINVRVSSGRSLGSRTPHINGLPHHTPPLGSFSGLGPIFGEPPDATGAHGGSLGKGCRQKASVLRDAGVGVGRAPRSLKAAKKSGSKLRWHRELLLTLSQVHQSASSRPRGMLWKLWRTKWGARRVAPVRGAGHRLAEVV